MNLKGRIQLKVQIALIGSLCLALLCPSFCVYAAKYESPKSHYYDESIDNYSDSYFQEGQAEDYSLIFFPPFPDTEYKYFMLIHSPETKEYYFLAVNKKNADFRMTATPYAYDIGLKFKKFKLQSLQWVYLNDETDEPNPNAAIGHSPKFPHGSYLIDSSGANQSFDWGQVVVNKSTKYTGYRFYWKLIQVEQFVFGYIDDFADLVLKNSILKYSLLSVFVGEFILFVISIIKRLGELNHE